MTYLAASLAATWGFVSNIYFQMMSGGYFEPRKELFPLLHAWSLSVEEQFYIFFPLLLMMIHKIKGNLSLILPILFAVMLGISEWLSGTDTYYFSIITRAHELMLGAIAAVLMQNGKRLPHYLNILGLILICFSFFYLNSGTRFPGLSSLLPSGGAFLIITATDKQNSVHRLLSARPFVFVGLLSYSLYLLHWPIISFAKYRNIPIDVPNGSVIIILTFFLAYLSWRFIEGPIRHSTLSARKALLLLLVFPAIVFFAFAGASLLTKGFPSRFDGEVRTLIESYSHDTDLSRTCSLRTQDGVSLDANIINTRCSFGAGASKPTVLLFGDSHANHFRPFVDHLAREAGRRAVYIVKGGCSPVDNRQEECISFRGAILQLIEKEKYEYVILAGNWSDASQADDFADLIARIQQSGATPIIFKRSITTSRDISRCPLYAALGWSNNEDCNLSARDVEERSRKTDIAIEDAAARYRGVTAINIRPLVCRDSQCQLTIEGVALLRDTNHLNDTASVVLGREYLLTQKNPLRKATSF
jgi:hypothetical protein